MNPKLLNTPKINLPLRIASIVALIAALGGFSIYSILQIHDYHELTLELNRILEDVMKRAWLRRTSCSTPQWTRLLLPPEMTPRWSAIVPP
ncbi:MAG: hypothetical protein HC842_04820 [Cytophagales bacterium]|nr:hypothetical protein [Cytophagales bacterium]